MKNKFSDGIIEEYFNRSRRRHPIWKSEAEYKAYLRGMSNGGDILDKFEDAIELTAKFMNNNSDVGIINDEAMQRVNEMIKAVEESGELDSEEKANQKREQGWILLVMKKLKEYSQEHSLEFDYVILTASEFNSGFGKADFSQTLVVFNTVNSEKIAEVKDIVASLTAKERNREKYFYIYYRRPEGGLDINKQDFCEFLLKGIGFGHPLEVSAEC